MRHERQVELLQRVADAGEHLRGLHAPACSVNPASAYTDPERFQRELQLLFRFYSRLIGPDYTRERQAHAGHCCSFHKRAPVNCGGAAWLFSAHD